MGLSFVNIHGQQISELQLGAMKAEGLEIERKRRAANKADQVSVHKGWRVTGVAPGLLDDARAAHERLQAMARKAGGKPIEDFDQVAWQRNAKRSAVRSKPYGLESAAKQCAELAGKAGWLDVQIQEIKKVVA